MLTKTPSFLILLLVIAVTVSGKILAQTNQASVRLTCERGEKMLRDEKKAIIILDHKHLKEIAVEQASPKFPRSCRCLGIIRVSILIDAKGRVKCVNTTEGHPLLRAVAMQAAKRWTFNPVIANGQAVSVRGELVFEFSADGQVTY